MPPLTELLSRNRRWATAVKMKDPAFFERLLGAQTPKYLWIGCSDSRVPANEIVALLPGELFVHRNVANLVVHTDLNCLSVVQFAIDVLHVEHIIVCGHYGCGGVTAADGSEPIGLADNWLRHIQDVRDHHRASLDAVESREERIDRLCELNVVEQARNVCRTSIVRGAWERGAELTVHAWIYRLNDGIIRDLGFSATDLDEANEQYEGAITALTNRPPGLRASRG